MRLGIDLDGVVSDFNKGWIDQYNAEFDAAIALDAVTTWDGIEPLTHFTDMDAFWEWARDSGTEACSATSTPTLVPSRLSFGWLASMTW